MEDNPKKVMVTQSQDDSSNMIPRKRVKVLHVQVEDDVEYFLAPQTQDEEGEGEDEEEDDVSINAGDDDDVHVVGGELDQSKAEEEEEEEILGSESEVPGSLEELQAGGSDDEEGWETMDSDEEEEEEEEEEDSESESESEEEDMFEEIEGRGEEEEAGPEAQSQGGENHVAQVHMALQEALMQETGGFLEEHTMFMQAEGHIQQQIATLSELKARVESSPNAKYFFKERPIRAFQVQTSSNHMQCAANIVLPPSGQSNLIFSYFRHNIYCFDLFRKRLVREYCHELDFYPISLTVNYGLVVAGGEDGELAIFSTLDNSLRRQDLGGSMNNSLEVIFHQGVQKLVVANNDGTVSVFKLPSLEKEKVIGPFPDAVNACKMSPDGKYLAVVGDFRQVFLVEITENDFLPPVPLILQRRNNKMVLVLAPGRTPSQDASAAPADEEEAEDSLDHQYPAWNLTSTLLAVTSDTHEFVTVWHVPTKTVVASIDAGDWTFPIQFSMMKEDLLVFANRRGFLHLVNVRTMDRQVLAVPKFAKINGFCFSPDFRKLYVALPNRIVEYGMNGPKSLVESCISVIQSQDPPLQIDWSTVPREIVVRVFPYNNLEVGKETSSETTSQATPSTKNQPESSTSSS